MSTLPASHAPICLGTGFCTEPVVHLRPAVQQFEAFHIDNPSIYERFVAAAMEWATETGDDRIGASHIIGRLRWNHGIRTKSAGFKINDHFGPYYARLAMLDYPARLGGIFETRSRAAADDPDAWIAHQNAFRATIVRQGVLC